MKGEAVYRVCADPQTPSAKAVYGWLRRQPAFVAMYTEARREAAQWLAFQAEMAADRAVEGLVSSQALAAIKREVARIEGGIGRLAGRTYR